MIYTALGQKDEALDWLERGYRVHDGNMVLLKGASCLGLAPLRPEVSGPAAADAVSIAASALIACCTIRVVVPVAVAGAAAARPETVAIRVGAHLTSLFGASLLIESEMNAAVDAGIVDVGGDVPEPGVLEQHFRDGLDATRRWRVPGGRRMRASTSRAA
jgi:hypothetical protein